MERKRVEEDGFHKREVIGSGMRVESSALGYIHSKYSQIIIYEVIIWKYYTLLHETHT